MSQTPSKKMLALNAVLLAVLLVSLPLQVRAYWPDAFSNAVGTWSNCRYDWWSCDYGCQVTYQQCQSDPAVCYDQLLWCLTMCGFYGSSCFAAIDWPDFELDYCGMAQSAYQSCQTEYSACASALGAENCLDAKAECDESSGIWQCQ
jgi:hypothetical protein